MTPTIRRYPERQDIPDGTAVAEVRLVEEDLVEVRRDELAGRSGPPLVRMNEMSKPLRVPLTTRMIVTAMVPRMSGRRTSLSCCHQLAPSISAALRISGRSR